MWFIIRSAFCVGLVYSMSTGEQGMGDFRNIATAALSSLGTPAERALVGSARFACENDAKFCLEVARRLASGDSAKSATQAQFNLVSDTLTAADRLPTWRGVARLQRPEARGRVETPHPTF
jgi:hypothetical protein